MPRFNTIPVLAIAMLLAAAASAQTPREVAEKVMPSVVVITTDAGNLSFEEQLDRGPTNKLGSGFFVADGIVATNYHVIRDVGRAFVKQIGDTKQFNVRGAVGHNENADLVLLAVEGLNARAPKLCLDKYSATSS